MFRAIVLASFAVLPGDFALAHHPASNPTGHKEEPVTLVPEADQPSLTSSIPALRDFKKGLLDRGVNFQLSYIQDTFGNPTGGLKQGANYGSVLYMAVDADLARLASLNGASFRVNAYQIQGRSLSDTIFSIIRRSAASPRGQRRGFSSSGSNRSFSMTWRRSVSVN